jgi:hypothetical protein
MSEAKIVYIENWGITTHPHYPDSEPCLRGVVTGHPRFRDGGIIISTSPIRALRAGRVITLSGTVYQLGKPDPNAFSEAFAIKREFAYLVLLLFFLSSHDPSTSPPAAPQAREPGSSAPVVAFAASQRNGRRSSIQ